MRIRRLVRFGVYGDLYLNDWAGFLSRGGYWAAIAVSIGAEMVASAVYMAHWFPRIPAIVWIALFSIVLLLVNLLDVGEYGRFEFWFAMVKVVTIGAFVVLGAGLLLTGHVAPQYTAQGGFFPMGILAPFLAMTFAIYTFGGIEFVAVSSGEARSPKEIAKATRITFAMLTLLYLGAIAVLVGVMPWNRAGVSGESVRDRVPFGEHPGGEPCDELCRVDGGSLGSECCTVRLFPNAFFHGAHRVGAGPARTTECARFTEIGRAGLLVRNSGRPRS